MGKIIGESITFDDVLLVPSYSEVIPNEVAYQLFALCDRHAGNTEFTHKGIGFTLTWKDLIPLRILKSRSNTVQEKDRMGLW